MCKIVKKCEKLCKLCNGIRVLAVPLDVQITYNFTFPDDETLQELQNCPSESQPLFLDILEKRTPVISSLSYFIFNS